MSALNHSFTSHTITSRMLMATRNVIQVGIVFLMARINPGRDVTVPPTSEARTIFQIFECRVTVNIAKLHAIYTDLNSIVNISRDSNGIFLVFKRRGLILQLGSHVIYSILFLTKIKRYAYLYKISLYDYRIESTLT